MALFGLKKDKKKESEETNAPHKEMSIEKKAAEKPAEVKSEERTRNPHQSLAWILRRQRITEKASEAQERRVYVFEVDVKANKRQISDAVQLYYKVKPLKVHTINRPSKKFFSRMRGRSGTVSGYKIAYVYMKKGESIEIV